MTLPTLIYFPIRGRAELIRIVAATAGLDWQEHPVTAGGADFQALRDSGELPFHQVPVWIEADGFRLAQSMAIARHLARGADLLGKTPREQALVDQLLGAYEDIRAGIRPLATSKPEERPKVRQDLDTVTLPRWLGFLDRIIDGRAFAVGEGLTLADLAIWYLLEMMGDLKLQAPLDGQPRLQAYAARIGATPRLAAYVTSARRFKFVMPA
jgi:glutathione S-transferase